jgi:hypothetical protein
LKKNLSERSTVEPSGFVTTSTGLRWPYLGAKAAALGVDIFPGFAGAGVLYGPAGAVLGVATGDMGIARDGSLKSGFTRGIELHGKYTLIAEGARGSLAKELIARFGLDNNREPQKFGIGLKELWRVGLRPRDEITTIPNGHEHVRRWCPDRSPFAAMEENRRPFVFLLGGCAVHKKVGMLFSIAGTRRPGIGYLGGGGIGHVFFRDRLASAPFQRAHVQFRHRRRSRRV